MGAVWTQMSYTHWDGNDILGTSYTEGTQNSYMASNIQPNWDFTVSLKSILRIRILHYDSLTPH